MEKADFKKSTENLRQWTQSQWILCQTEQAYSAFPWSEDQTDASNAGSNPPCDVSDQFFYLQLKFTPKIGHTFTDEREVVVEVPKDLVQRKSESAKESLREVIALGFAKSAALGTFPTEAERVAGLNDEDPPICYQDRTLG
jgi:hypothetical protein